MYFQQLKVNNNSTQLWQISFLKKITILVYFGSGCRQRVFGACFDLLPCLKPWHGGKLTMTSCNLTIKDSITERHGLKSFMTDGSMLNLTYNQNSSSCRLKTYSTDANTIAWRNTENQQNHSTHFRMTFHACCRYLRNSGRPFEAN